MKDIEDKRNKSNKLNRKMKFWNGTCKEPFWGPPFLHFVAPKICYDKSHLWAW
jgi:hypothetical protein